ncbi:MAG: hypothetical protein JOY54_08790 [Acidobacteriaceae bacterium]|nr:hypothetical protein [Acidobacteriaceae bacterium]
MTISRRAVDFASSPFSVLVAHFIKRLCASENEQGSSSLGLGLGMVLAVLASPGAFASIFLLEKYSTLLQWLRGQHIDPIRASPSDEYFFIVLSMTITGLVMVLRWNRLLPDRRDFSNLAVLPIPIRNIFLANFAALLGLAFLFGIDVNGVSVLFFPLFVTLSDGSTAAFLHVGISHAVSVLSASLFSFFAVFALVGLSMLLLPRTWFRPVSILLRIVLVIALLTEFFSNLLLQFLAGRVPAAAASYMHFLPSFWFLGLYERMLGIAKPALAALGMRSVLYLAVVILVAVAAYALCYRRYFLRLGESLDVIRSPRHNFRLGLPEPVAKLLFRSPFEHGCFTFVLKALFRSEPHLLFFGAYLGGGLVLIAQTAMDSTAGVRSAGPDEAYLAVPLLLAFFIVSGLRFTFDIPATLDANWVFRASVEAPQPEARAVARRMLMLATVSWQIVVLAPVTAAHFGWLIALLHTGTVVALTILFIDVLLLRFRKIPFTCVTQPDIKRLLPRILGSVLGVLVAVPLLASIERWMLAEPFRFVSLALAVTIAWHVLDRKLRDMLPFERTLTFEDNPEPQFELLKLA